MTNSAQSARTLMEKIQSLPADRIAEVEDFVDFLSERARQRKASAPGREPLDFPVDNLAPSPEGFG